MAEAKGTAMNAWRKIYKHRMFFPLVCLLIVLLLDIITIPNFFTFSITNGVLYSYVVDILNRSSELIILAVGMTLVVACSAGTDISVGAVSAVSGAAAITFLGWGVYGGANYSLYEYQSAFPYVIGFLVALLTGAICGMWNGFLVSKLRIQPMVATLILMTGGRGLAQLLCDGQIKYVRIESYRWLGNVFPGVPIPTPIMVAALVVIVTSLVLKYTALGMNIQSVGINNKASRIVGLKSSRIIMLAYTFCGLCAGLAGMMYTSRIYSIDANNVGLSVELDAILAVALGGNSLGGGKFSLAGSVIGAITIQALSTSLLAMKVSSDQLPVYKAIVVIIIVSLQSPVFRGFVSKLTGKFLPKKAGAES